MTEEPPPQKKTKFSKKGLMDKKQTKKMDFEKEDKRKIRKKTE